MNDPGFDKTVDNTAPQVNRERDEHQYDGAEDEEEREFLDPSRWWFAATACPLIAGTFGPMASAFSICALASHWRQTFPVGGSELNARDIPDPAWLIIVNAVSLGAAIVANSALLFNMAGRARFEIAQPVTIIGFFVAAILLIPLVAKAGTADFLGDSRTHALTQAFYYAIWAAGIYTIITALMVMTVWGALAGKYERRFNLTTSQRTLMLQTISFMAYLLVGAAIFSALEGWTFLDAVFWADFTLLTIGLGLPFVPTTHAARSLLFFYAVGGIVTVGLIIGSIRSMLLETAKQKMKARATEKRRNRVASWVDVVNARKRLLPGAHLEHEPANISHREHRRRNFHAMRKIQARANRASKYVSLAGSTFAACVLWFIGALVFKYAEYQQGWTYFTALYFSYTTLLTIGYGDFTPQSNSGKSFFVLWSLLAVPTLTVLISDLGDTFIKGVAEATNYVAKITFFPDESGISNTWQRVLKDWGALGRQAVGAEKDKDPYKSKKSFGDDTAAQDQTTKPAPSQCPEEFDDPADLLHERLHQYDLEMCRAYAEKHSPASPSAETGTDIAANTPASTPDDLSTDPDQSLEQDHRFYQWLLVREIQAVLADTSATPPRTYTYDEWSYFLRLLGHDERAFELNRRAKRLVRSPGSPLNTQGSATRGRGGASSAQDEHEPLLGRIFDADGNRRQWSWIGLRSPLMSPKAEAEWVLGELVGKLAREADLRRPRAAERTERPPVSLRVLRRKGKGSVLEAQENGRGGSPRKGEKSV